jgi:hypothetical protein
VDRGSLPPIEDGGTTDVHMREGGEVAGSEKERVIDGGRGIGASPKIAHQYLPNRGNGVLP